MRDHLVLGLGFVLIAINARAAEPAAGGLEGILDQMEKHASAQSAHDESHLRAKSSAKTPRAPAESNSSATRAEGRTGNVHVGVTQEQNAQQEQSEMPPDEESEEPPTPVFDSTRRSALADTPLAPGGLERILNTQELAGSMTLVAPIAPAGDLNKNIREKRLDERLK